MQHELDGRARHRHDPSDLRPEDWFARPAVTLRFAGATNSGGIVYRWSTTIKLKRIVRK